MKARDEKDTHSAVSLMLSVSGQPPMVPAPPSPSPSPAPPMPTQLPLAPLVFYSAEAKVPDYTAIQVCDSESRRLSPCISVMTSIAAYNPRGTSA